MLCYIRLLSVFILLISPQISYALFAIEQAWQQVCRETPVTQASLRQHQFALVNETAITTDITQRLPEINNQIKSYLSGLTKDVTQYRENLYCALWGIDTHNIKKHGTRNILSYYHNFRSLQFIQKAVDHQIFDTLHLQAYRLALRAWLPATDKQYYLEELKQEGGAIKYYKALKVPEYDSVAPLQLIQVQTFEAASRRCDSPEKVYESDASNLHLCDIKIIIPKVHEPLLHDVGYREKPSASELAADHKSCAGYIFNDSTMATSILESLIKKMFAQQYPNHTQAPMVSQWMLKQGSLSVKTNFYIDGEKLKEDHQIRLYSKQAPVPSNNKKNVLFFKFSNDEGKVYYYYGCSSGGSKYYIWEIPVDKNPGIEDEFQVFPAVEPLLGEDNG